MSTSRSASGKPARAGGRRAAATIKRRRGEYLSGQQPRRGGPTLGHPWVASRRGRRPVPTSRRPGVRREPRSAPAPARRIGPASAAWASFASSFFCTNIANVGGARSAAGEPGADRLGSAQPLPRSWSARQRQRLSGLTSSEHVAVRVTAAFTWSTSSAAPTASQALLVVRTLPGVAPERLDQVDQPRRLRQGPGSGWSRCPAGEQHRRRLTSVHRATPPVRLARACSASASPPGWP